MYSEEKATPRMEDGTEARGSGYQEYRALGGIINEIDYGSAIGRISQKVKEITDTSDGLKAQAERGILRTDFQGEELRKIFTLSSQAKMMADAAGIELQSDEVLAGVAGTGMDAVKFAKDPRVVLYTILRNDTMPSDEEYNQTKSNGPEMSVYRDGNVALMNDGQEKYHHSQMSDQAIFAEALRMLGDETSLKKFTSSFPNIFPKKAGE